LEKILYFDCFSGISGDMALAGLIDLGLPQDKLRRGLDILGLKGYSLEITRGNRNGISAKGLQVRVEEGGNQRRNFIEIQRLIETSSLEDGVKQTSLDIFHRLAEAGAAVQGQTVEEVHFRELGAADAIVDIVGTAIGIEHFQPMKIYSSELPIGTGFVQSEYGRLPLPAPTTIQILKGYPLRSIDLEAELVTPTGAAILVSLSAGPRPLPAMKVNKIGYGMGQHEFSDRPNLLRLMFGEEAACYQTGQAVVLEANIDDMNPQFYDYLIDRLYESGALDVSLSPLLMKKNRPGTLLRVIAREHEADALSELILSESTTLGVRSYGVNKRMFSAKVCQVETRYGKVRVKVAGGKRPQPEYEDCKRIALERKVSLQEVYQEALDHRKDRL